MLHSQALYLIRSRESLLLGAEKMDRPYDLRRASRK